MSVKIPLFTRWLFEFQSKFCRPYGTCQCGSTEVVYEISDDQYLVPRGKVRMEGLCSVCQRMWKEIASDGTPD